MKSDLLDCTPTPARPAHISGIQPRSGQEALAVDPLAFRPQRSVEPRSSPSPVPSSEASDERQELFFSVEQAEKITMINNMAQLWGLPPHITPEGTPTSLEEAQVRFIEVLSSPFLNVVLFKLVFDLTCVFFDGRVRLFACHLCVRFLPSVCPR